MNCAYVTLLATDDYVYGVLGLNRSLQLVEAFYPLHVIVTDNVASETMALLDDNNIPYTVFPYKNFEHRNANYLLTYNQFYAYNLNEYDSICLIDADAVVMENIDRVFEYNPTTLFTPFEEKEIGGHMMLINPKEYEESDFETYRTTCADANAVFTSVYDLKSCGVFDQSLNASVNHHHDGGRIEGKYWNYFFLDSVDKVRSFIDRESQNNYSALFFLYEMNEIAYGVHGDI